MTGRHYLSPKGVSLSLRQRTLSADSDSLLQSTWPNSAEEHKKTCSVSRMWWWVRCKPSRVIGSGKYQKTGSTSLSDSASIDEVIAGHRFAAICELVHHRKESSLRRNRLPNLGVETCFSGLEPRYSRWIKEKWTWRLSRQFCYNSSQAPQSWSKYTCTTWIDQNRSQVVRLNVCPIVTRTIKAAGRSQRTTRHKRRLL